MRGLAWIGPLAALVALGACRSAERTEAASLVAAVDRYRRADNADKPAAAETIRAVACSAPDVCRARDACLASADATSKALRLKHEVEISLAAVEHGTLAKDSPEAQALSGKLDEAEAMLKEGFQLLQPCDEQIQALKRKNSL